MGKLLLNAAVLMSALTLWNGNAVTMPSDHGLHAPDVIRADWQCGPRLACHVLGMLLAQPAA
ncbi:hypothetical protein [Rhodoplanes elegans]|uniref:hypothetical protein n=1 Tax=Rhodoplanes elegans TaxID=29408 RepID=UPI001FD516B5|nr:hypothetical protein [Rhodoplanes elegans]